MALNTVLHSKGRLQTLPANFRQDVTGSNKHSSLQQYTINYDRKMFYNVHTRVKCYKIPNRRNLKMFRKSKIVYPGKPFQPCLIASKSEQTRLKYLSVSPL